MFRQLNRRRRLDVVSGSSSAKSSDVIFESAPKRSSNESSHTNVSSTLAKESDATETIEHNMLSSDTSGDSSVLGSLTPIPVEDHIDLEGSPSEKVTWRLKILYKSDPSKTINLKDDVILIGSNETKCNVVLSASHGNIAPIHAELTKESRGNGWFLKDFGFRSQCPVFIRSEKLQLVPHVQYGLIAGDDFHIGNYRLVVEKASSSLLGNIDAPAGPSVMRNPSITDSPIVSISDSVDLDEQRSRIVGMNTPVQSSSKIRRTELMAREARHGALPPVMNFMDSNLAEYTGLYPARNGQDAVVVPSSQALFSSSPTHIQDRGDGQSLEMTNSSLESTLLYEASSVDLGIGLATGSPGDNHSVSNLRSLSTVASKQRPLKIKSTGVRLWRFPIAIINAEEVKSISDTDVLIAEKAMRTVKFLEAVCRGVVIVTDHWLLDSLHEGRALSFGLYELKDAEFEAKHSCSLASALEIARHGQGFLKSVAVYITSSVKPSSEEMKLIVTAAGGVLLSDLVHLKLDSDNLTSCICITNEDDVSQRVKVSQMWGRYLAKKLGNLLNPGKESLGLYLKSNPVTFHNVEIILTGVLRQTLDLNSFRLK